MKHLGNEVDSAIHGFNTHNWAVTVDMPLRARVMDLLWKPLFDMLMPRIGASEDLP